MKLNKYDWSLDHILKYQSLDQLHDQWLNEQKGIIELYPNFYKTKLQFKQWLKLNEQHAITTNRLINYVSNNLAEELINPKWIAWSQKLNQENHTFAVKLANYENIVIDHQKLILNYLKDPNIKIYARAFDLVFRHKPHRLNPREEALMSKVSITHGGFETIFETLTNSDIKFKPATNSKNKSIPLTTIADVSRHLKSNDRKLRQTTWINFNKAFHAFESTLTQTLYYNYLLLNTNAKIYKFKDYVELTVFSDEINREFILNLYQAIAKFKPLINNYRLELFKKLKQQLHLTELEPWDKTIELSKVNINFDIEQTKQMTLMALKPLGKDYINKIANDVFVNNWISWLAKPNKQAGAYSIGGTKGLDRYYISMNFDHTLNSISTIVHELGHSMNSFYTNKQQKIYTNNPIFCAEIASIVNEQLLYYYLLDKYKDNQSMQRYVLDRMLSSFFATTTRQIIFSNFEYVMNEYINKNMPFTKEVVRETYQSMIEKYQGFIDHENKLFNQEPYSYGLSTIFRIGHFYVGNFYVYKYAVGQIVAILIADQIYHHKSDTLKKYFKFLSSGSSLPSLETIKILGIDLTKQTTYDQVYQIVERWIELFKHS